MAHPSGPHLGWQERTLLLLGKEALVRMESSHVLIAGMGGVGAMAAEMICRGGAGRMTLIDADIIQPSNLNRQLPATHSTLGKGKAVVMGERLLDINPGLSLTVIEDFISEETIPGILETNPDYVVDAIDTLSPKIHLIHQTVQKGIKLTSSMGSGGKTDPAQVRVADFADTYNCRLAFVLRKKLRKMGVGGGFSVVFSTEQVPDRTVVQVEGEPNKKSTVGTCSFLPAIFGCTLASIVIRDLAGVVSE